MRGSADQFERVVATDFSPVWIAQGQEELGWLYPQLVDRVELKVTSAEEPMPFADASFDVVAAIALIEHVVDVFETVDQIARVCRPGGCAIICVPNLAYVKHLASLVTGRVPLTGAAEYSMAHWREHAWDGGHLHNFTLPALRALLDHVGFDVEEWSGSGRFGRLRRALPALVSNLTVRARRH